MAITQDQLGELRTLQTPIAEALAAWINTHSWETFREGVDILNSEQTRQTAATAIAAIVTGSVSNWPGLRAAAVPSAALPSFMAAFDTALTAGNANDLFAAAVGIALANKALRA
jgi:hypothetical protein